jgi:hypothetical protein
LHFSTRTPGREAFDQNRQQLVCTPAKKRGIAEKEYAAIILAFTRAVALGFDSYDELTRSE